MTDLLPREDRLRSQMHSAQVPKEQLPEVPNAYAERAKAAKAVNTQSILEDATTDGVCLSDYPVRFVPHVNLNFLAVEDDFTAVVKTVKRHTEDDVVYDLLNPLRPYNTKKGTVGVARDGLTNLFAFVADIANTPYLFVGQDDEVVCERIIATVDSIQEQLQVIFYGEQRLMEEEGADGYSIDKQQMFSFGVGVKTNTVSGDTQTVNEVNILIDVFMHAPIFLTSDMPEKTLSAYRKYVDSRAADLDINTSMSVVFDASNFLVCPEALFLFNYMLNSESVVRASSITNNGTQLIAAVETRKEI